MQSVHSNHSLDAVPVEIMALICARLPNPVGAAAVNRAFRKACQLAFPLAVSRAQTARDIIREASDRVLDIPDADVDTLMRLHCEVMDILHEYLKSPLESKAQAWLFWHITQAHTGREIYALMKTYLHKRVRAGCTYEHDMCICMVARDYILRVGHNDAEADCISAIMYDRMRAGEGMFLPFLHLLSTESLCKALICETVDHKFRRFGLAELFSRDEDIPEEYVVPIWAFAHSAPRSFREHGARLAAEYIASDSDFARSNPTGNPLCLQKLRRFRMDDADNSVVDLGSPLAENGAPGAGSALHDTVTRWIGATFRDRDAQAGSWTGPAEVRVALRARARIVAIGSAINVLSAAGSTTDLHTLSVVARGLSPMHKLRVNVNGVRKNRGKVRVKVRNCDGRMLGYTEGKSTAD